MARDSPAPPKEVVLVEERESREQLNLFRPNEDVTITTSSRIVILPAERGKGWILRIYEDPVSS